MITKSDEKLLLLAGVAAGALIAFPDLVGRILGRVTTGAVSGAASVVYHVGTGAVLGIGEAIGIPQTDADKCAGFIAAGDYWQASFYCPAGTFLQSAAGAVYDAATGALVGNSAPTGQAEVIRITAPEPTPGIDVPGGGAIVL